MRDTALTVPAILLLIAVPAAAAVVQVPCTGELIDGGTPLTGWHQIDVSLWDAPAGGTAVHPQSATLLVEQGVFHVALRVRGDTAPTTTLDVYDVRGRLVRRLSTGTGAQHDARDLVWTLDDAAGRRVAAGLYFVRPAWHGAGHARAVLVVP